VQVTKSPAQETQPDWSPDYAWPGNIRELQNLIERAVIRSTGERLEVPVWDLDQRVVAAPKIIASPRTIDECSAHRTLEETERAQILATLKETGGVLSGPKGAAKILGIHRSTLQFRMKKLGIERRPSEYDLVGEVAE
jgi:formate hydrogenlyase transcriptional activator